MIDSLFNGIHLYDFIFLAISCFVAAFIDAIAGGGGLISLPAFMSVGIDPHIALGTNKLAAFFSCSSSASNFAKSGIINWKVIKRLVPFSFLGAILGVISVVHVNSKFLSPLALILLICVLFYTLKNKNLGKYNNFCEVSKEHLKIGMFFAFILGFYDGFFGPGTGSFIIFALIKIFKFDFVRASGNAKFLNLSSNMSSVISFIFYKKIAYFYAITMGIIMIIGAALGARMAISKGSKFIRPIFLLATTATLAKMIYSLISSN